MSCSILIAKIKESNKFAIVNIQKFTEFQVLCSSAEEKESWKKEISELIDKSLEIMQLEKKKKKGTVPLKLETKLKSRSTIEAATIPAGKHNMRVEEEEEELRVKFNVNNGWEDNGKTKIISRTLSRKELIEKFEILEKSLQKEPVLEKKKQVLFSEEFIRKEDEIGEMEPQQEAQTRKINYLGKKELKIKKHASADLSFTSGLVRKRKSKNQDELISLNEDKKVSAGILISPVEDQLRDSIDYKGQVFENADSILESEGSKKKPTSLLPPPIPKKPSKDKITLVKFQRKTVKLASIAKKPPVKTRHTRSLSNFCNEIK